MIVGIGTDLCDVQRLESDLHKGEWSVRDDIFTASEIAYCEASSRPAEHYAARLAAKEALFKALGLDGRNGLVWRQVEIDHEPNGRPRMTLHGAIAEFADRLGVGTVLLSLAHATRIAVGTVVLESRETAAPYREVTR